jgi:hypothetical protein
LAWITQDWLPNKRVQPTRALGDGFDQGGFSVGAAADAQGVGRQSGWMWRKDEGRVCMIFYQQGFNDIL